MSVNGVARITMGTSWEETTTGKQVFTAQCLRFPEMISRRVQMLLSAALCAQ